MNRQHKDGFQILKHRRLHSHIGISLQQHVMLTEDPYENKPWFYYNKQYFYCGIYALRQMYFICGVLYILSERNTTKRIVTISLVFSILAILGTVLAAIIFIRTLVAHPYHYMMYQDPYNDNDTDVVEEHYMQLYSLEAVFLFHSLVAGVILIAMSVFARLALRSSHTQMFVVMRYPPSAE